MKKRIVKGYICGTDLQDISLGAKDVVIFPTVKFLKKKRSCWKECGILELNLSNAKYISKPGLNNAK